MIAGVILLLWLIPWGLAWYVGKRWTDAILRQATPPSRIFTADPEDETDYREAPPRGVTVREIALTDEERDGLTLSATPEEEALARGQTCIDKNNASGCRCLLVGRKRYPHFDSCGCFQCEAKRGNVRGGNVNEITPVDGVAVSAGTDHRIQVAPEMVIPLARAIVNPTRENVVSLAEARQRKVSAKALGRG